MNKAFNKIFWGIMLVYVNVNIGSFDILPNFIGFLLIYFGINELIKETGTRDLNKYRYLAIFFFVVSLFTTIFGGGRLLYFEIFMVFLLLGQIVLFKNILSFGYSKAREINSEDERLKDENINLYLFFAFGEIIAILWFFVTRIDWVGIIVGVFFIVKSIILLVKLNYLRKFDFEDQLEN